MGQNGKNEYTKLNSTMIKNLKIKIPMPVREDDTFDLIKQQEIVSKYELIKITSKCYYIRKRNRKY